MALLDCIESETGPAPRFSVVWLHGLGADGGDFAPIVPQLLHRHWPAIRFVFPHAPVRPVTVNGGMPMRAWYDIRGVRIEDKQDQAGVFASIAEVNALLDRETTRGIPPERQILAGFSQGGAITLAALLRRQQPLAAAIALSSYLPLAEESGAAVTAVARVVPVFLGHGSLDPVVPIALGNSSRDWLQAHGFKPTWHTYLMAHSVCADEIADLGRFLDPILTGPSSPT